MDWYEIVIAIFAVSSIVGGFYIKHLVGLIRETGEMLTAIADAAEDGKFTKKEILTILKEAKDVADAFHKVIALFTIKTKWPSR